MYWFKTVGKRGYGVAVRQRSKRRNIELKWWDRERKTYRTRTLGHRDCERAIGRTDRAERHQWRDDPPLRRDVLDENLDQDDTIPHWGLGQLRI